MSLGVYCPEWHPLKVETVARGRKGLDTYTFHSCATCYELNANQNDWRISESNEELR